MATGVRVGELLGAAWSGTRTSEQALQCAADLSGAKLGFVDMERRLWQLPNTKNQRSHTIHLSGFAVAQFLRLADMSVAPVTDPSIAVSWVFPNEGGTGPVSVKSFGKQLSDRQREPGRRLAHRTRMTSALMLPGGRWTAHDLRRTAATLMARLGISGDVIDECLNHMIESRMRRVYIRDRREPDQARAFDALGAHLSRLQEPIKPVKRVSARVPKRAVENASRALQEVV